MRRRCVYERPLAEAPFPCPRGPQALLHLRTLAGLRVERDGEVLPLRRKDALLLAYVGLHPRPVQRSAAASLLWGESSDAAARLSLRQAIWRLHNELGDAIHVTPSTLTTDPALLAIDVRELSAHVAAGRYREAVALAETDFLAGVDQGATNEFELWVDEVRSQVSHGLLVSLQQLVRDADRDGDWEDAARVAARWCEMEPDNPLAAMELAQALRSAGHAAQALATLTAFMQRARNAAGDTPDVDLRQLARELRQEAARSRAGDEGIGIPSATDGPHQRLVAEWERTTFGHSKTLLVAGVPAEAAGMCRAFVEWVQAHGSGHALLRATCVESRQSSPHATVRTIIDGLRTAPGLGGAAEDALGQLAAWSPALRDRFPRLPALPPQPAMLADALRRTCEAVTDEVPLLVFIENGHLCDAESAATLAELMRHPPARVLMVVSTSADPAGHTPWEDLQAGATTIALPRRTSRRLPVIAALAAVTVVAAMGWIVRDRSLARMDGPIAVGTIEVIGESDSLSLANAVPGLLATRIALAHDLNVISGARLHEVTGQLLAAGARTPSGIEVARAAGARTLLEGELYREGEEFRIAVRRVRVATGSVDQAYEALGSNVFSLVDDMADQIARSYNAEVPRQGIGGAATTSLVAYRFYEQGLRAYYGNDPASAFRDFQAALDQDSLFAMAAYLASQTAPAPDESLRLFQRAVRLADRASDRDRLLIQAQWALRNGSRSLLALAETLAIRYPHDPEGQYYFGVAIRSTGRFEEAAQRFQAAVTLDSVALLGRLIPCHACEAIETLVMTHMSEDSLQRAQQVAEKWTRLQPWSLKAWTALGAALEFQGRYAAADTAFARAEAAQPELSDLGGHRVELAMRAGRFDAVDSILALGLASEDAGERSDALFKSVLSDRMQGRFGEALAAARELEGRQPDAPSRLGPVSLEARVMLEMGWYPAAAALYDSVAQVLASAADVQDQRAAAAWLANEAVALASMGDTAALGVVEAQVRHYGSLSVERRDATLHLFVLGLREEITGDLDGAISSYRAAVGSPTSGNVQASLALARALIARDRAAEAVPVLDAAIRGSLGASGTPVTKTELHALMGAAFEATGQPGKARAEYQWVLNAWRRADPELAPRRARIQARLRALEGR